MALTEAGSNILSVLKTRKHQIDNAEQLKRESERNEWLLSETFRLFKQCDELQDTMTTILEIVTGTEETETDEDFVRLKAIGDYFGIDLTDLEYKPVLYPNPDKPSVPKRSYQITAALFLFKLESVNNSNDSAS